MSLDPFDDVQTLRTREAEGVPIVTIFGAGVAGLTVAHELVERGFAVQVVESRSDPDEEYMCRIGGLAANRFARIPADLSQVHPYFFPEDPDGEDTVDPDAGRWVDLIVLGGCDITLTVDDASVTATLPPPPGDAAQALQDALMGNPSAASKASAKREPPGGTVVRLRPGAGRRDPLRVSATTTPEGRVLVEEVATLRPLRQNDMKQVQRRYEIPERFSFETPAAADWTVLTDEQGVANGAKIPVVWERIRAAYQDYFQQMEEALTGLGNALTERMRIRELLLVELRGHTDDEVGGGSSRALSGSWAEQVRQGLIAHNDVAPDPIPDLERRLVVVPLGNTEPVGRQLRKSGRARSNRVEVRIVEHVIPGEHGYRFFPAFYRNLFDTMKRTPILDEQGCETGETAFDQLVSTHVIDVALEGGAEPEEVKLRWPRSLEELRKLLRLHLEKSLRAEGLELTERDLLRFYLRIVKFLTSSKERRKQDYEEESWWEFLGGNAVQGYSPEMQRLLQEAPQALVAMDAEETDARSQGVVFCQLLLDALSPWGGTNYTLNGPTSDAWLCYWKRYLRRQGARFFVGRLAKILETDAGCVPLVTLPATQGTSLHLSVIEGNPSATAQRSYAVRINGVEIRRSMDPGSHITQVRDHLAAALRDTRLPIQVSTVQADPAVAPRLRNDPGGILIENRVLPGDLVVTVREARALDYRFEVNGAAASFSVPAGSSEQALRDALRSHFPPLDVDLADFGMHGLQIRPGHGGQVISILGRAQTATLSVDDMPVALQPGAALDAQPLRDQLLGEIQSQVPGLTVRQFGDTGILVLPDSQGRRPFIDVTASPGTLCLGMQVRISRGAGDWVVFRDGELRGRVIEGPLGLEGSIAESGDDVLITDDVGGPSPPGEAPDVYVLAVDTPEASRIVSQAQADLPPPHPPLDGCFQQLLAFDDATGYRVDGELQPPQRDASGRPSPRRYPLRDLSGIQYYWSHQVRLGKGHTYYADAPWGLSSIAQLAYWKQRTGKHAAFLGQLSVDIGDWYESVRLKSDPPQAGGPSAWRSSKQAIAEGVYGQVLEGVEANLAANLVRPDWYHLDPGIRFEGPEGLCFGRRALLEVLTRPVGSTYSLEVDGTTVSAVLNTTLGALADDLAAAISAETGHLAAHVSADRVLIAPIVRRREPDPQEVLITVLEAVDGALYRIARGAQVAQVTATGADVQAVRNDLVSAVNAILPGVIAAPVGAASLRLRAAQDLEVSALGTAPAVGGPDPARPLLALDPAGEVRVRIVPGAEGLRIGNEEEASPFANDTPFLINGPGVWKQRPGLYDGSPLPTDIAQHYADEGGIYVRPSCERWFMAGVHMATHTRLSTMESANESARHTVRAILYEILAASPGPPAKFMGASYLLGDPPAIFDPEEHELPDADPLKRLDARLWSEDLPHFIDILRLPELVDAAPPDLATLIPDAQQLGDLLGYALDRLSKDWEFTSADEIVAHLRETLVSFLDVVKQPPPP